MAQDPKVIAYFEGEAFWTAFDAQRNEYAGPGARLRILQKGKKFYVQVCDETNHGGDPINEAKPCPGSPGC